MTRLATPADRDHILALMAAFGQLWGPTRADELLSSAKALVILDGDNGIFWATCTDGLNVDCGITLGADDAARLRLWRMCFQQAVIRWPKFQNIRAAMFPTACQAGTYQAVGGYTGMTKGTTRPDDGLETWTVTRAKLKARLGV
jgi:hypothetical protein